MSDAVCAASWADRIDVFHGAATDATCRVYARLDAAEREAGWHLSGTLLGPECAYAQTLPATFSFVDRGPGPTLLAEAIVPEPCFWTPEMPHVYRAAIQLRRPGEVLAEAERSVGIRRLGTLGRGLRFGSRAWVLRGVSADAAAVEVSQWHEAGAALVARRPDDTLCAAASRMGVLVVAELDRPDSGEIRRLSRQPAVGIVSLAGAAPPPPGVGHNLLFAQRFGPAEPIAPAAWADLVMCEEDATSMPTSRIAACNLPVVVVRRGASSSARAGRAACDGLQRDLASHGQFAGYIV